MSAEELESHEAHLRIRAWLREQVLESIKPLKAGKRRPVFRPPHLEIAINQPLYRKHAWNQEGFAMNAKSKRGSL